MNKVRIPAFLVVFLAPLVFFSWCKFFNATNAFWIILSFLLMWLFFWFMWFFGEPYTPLEACNYLVREAQALALGVEFFLTVAMLLFNASMRTCFYINAFSYGFFILATTGIILYHAELIRQLCDEEGGDPQ